MTTTKTRTRIGVLLLSILLIFSMGMVSTMKPAMAANEGSLTIHKLSSEGKIAAGSEPGVAYWQNPVDKLFYAYLAGATYTAYKIGTMTQTSTDPISVSYTPIPGLIDKAKTPNPITTLDETTDPNNIKITDEMINDEINPPITLPTTTTTGPVSTNELDENTVYLVVETTTPEGVNAATNFIITVPMNVDGTWIKDIVAFPKNVHSNPSISKTMAGANEDNVLYGNVGDKIPYTITVKIPSDYETGIYKELVITDIPHALLSKDDNSLKVVLTPASPPQTPEVLIDETRDPVIDTLDLKKGSAFPNGFTLTATDSGLKLFKNDDVITITYTATILNGSLTSQGGITNDAILSLGGTIKPVTPEEPQPEVRIYSYGIQKTNSDTTPAPLEGAIFKVATDAAGTNFLSYDSTTGVWSPATADNATPFETKTTGAGIDSEAILQFRNLDETKTYYLVETEAPNGFMKLPNPIAIQATEASTDAVYSSYEQEADGTWTYQSGVGYSLTVANTPTSFFPGFLPNTGGLGTFLFIAIGTILIAGAVVLFARNRKRSDQTSH